MEIIRSIALYAGWGFVALAALFAIGVAFMLIQSRNKKDGAEAKESKVRFGGAKTKKPKRAESLVHKVEAVSREESAQRILGGVSTPLPAQTPTLGGLPTQVTTPEVSPTAGIQLPRPEAKPDGSVSFVSLPGRLPEPPKL